MTIQKGTLAGHTAREPEPVRGAPETVTKPGAAIYVAAALSLAAAVSHLWVLPEHMLLWWGYGGYFLGVALAQGLCAVLVLRWPTTRVFLAGIWGNLSVVVFYVWTRTSGVPFGPHAGKVEDAGLLDLAATAAELGVVLALVTLLGGVYRGWTINALLLLGIGLWALRFAGAL